MFKRLKLGQILEMLRRAFPGYPDRTVFLLFECLGTSKYVNLQIVAGYE